MDYRTTILQQIRRTGSATCQMLEHYLADMVRNEARRWVRAHAPLQIRFLPNAASLLGPALPSEFRIGRVHLELERAVAELQREGHLEVIWRGRPWDPSRQRLAYDALIRRKGGPGQGPENPLPRTMDSENPDHLDGKEAP